MGYLMRRIGFSALCLVGIVFAVYVGSAYPEEITGRVVGVMDGDTIAVTRTLPDGRIEQIKVRLASIDCPEKGQPWGNKAKEYTSGQCFGKTVALDITGMDRYGRHIAFVILPDGKNLNHELVKAGMGWWYQRYAHDDHMLEALEAEARENSRGLWSDREPIPPWEWRNR